MSPRKCIVGSVFALLVLFAVSCNDYPRGEQLYVSQCASCHMDDGTGLGYMIPSLQYSELLKSDPGRVACIIRYGIVAEDSTSQILAMPAYPRLTETDISNLINYMNNAWENDFEETSPDVVEAALESCAERNSAE